MIPGILGVVAAVAALILLNAIYVAAEFALVGAPRSRLEALARSGVPRARRVLALSGSLRALDRSIATAQLGITVASLGLGMYGEHAVAALLRPLLEGVVPFAGPASHGLASGVAIAGLTFLHIVLGETVPKAIALQHPVRTSLAIEVPIRVTRFALTPFVWFLDVVGAQVLRLLRVPSETDAARAHTTEEIEALIEEGGSGGVIGTRLAEILVNLLEFHELPVRKIMIPRTRVVGMEAGITMVEALRILRETEHTRYPVCEDDLDHIVGFVHAKDLMRAFGGDGSFDLRTLARPLPHIPAEAPARHLLRELREQRVQMAVVLDEHGGTAGIATFEDLIEEIFGEVQDEFDLEEPPIRRLTPLIALVDGALRVDELNESLNLSLPDDLVDSVGGLVLHALGRTARLGDIVRFEGVTLTVESVRGHAVTRVRLERGVRS